MSYLKKFLPLVLVLAMLLTMFAACNDSSDPKDTETESKTETESESESENSKVTGSESTDESVEVSILDDVTFPDKVLNVLVENRGNLPEYTKELTDSMDILDKAIYDRCDHAENRLQLRTKWEIIDSTDTYREKAELENSNGGLWDVMDSRSESAPILMTRGVFSNLMGQKYFDFKHPGWSQSIVADLTVANKLYFATGDISTNLVFMTGVVFFNKSLVKDLGVNEKIKANYEAESLYELATTGKWTLDKLLTLSENSYKDQNNNGKKDTGDRYGFTTYHNLFPNFYWGGGYKCVNVVDGGFEISTDYLNPELVGNILSTVNTFLYDTKDGFIESDYSKSKANFAAGNALFTMGPASHAWNTYSTTEDLEYSVLPIPKHSESQARYCATQSTNYLVISIASQSKNAEASSAFIQALTEASYEITRPALIDKLMKGRYAEDPEDAEMWDLAIDANVFDVGRVYGHMFTEDGDTLPLPEKLIRDKIQTGNNNWSQTVQGRGTQLVIMANSLAGQIAGLPD